MTAFTKDDGARKKQSETSSIRDERGAEASAGDTVRPAGLVLDFLSLLPASEEDSVRQVLLEGLELKCKFHALFKCF